MTKILSCTDGSLYATSVYKATAWAATRLNLPVHVLHILERKVISPSPDFSGEIGMYADVELLQEFARLDEENARIGRLRGSAILQHAIRSLGDISTTSSLLDGSLVDELAKIEVDTKLIVVGKRGENADFAASHLGSNLERIARSSQVPLLVASFTFKPIQRFLFAFDGGKSSLNALHYILNSSLLKGLECQLVTVGADHISALKLAAHSLELAGFSVITHCLEGDVEDVITAKLEQTNSNLLVMGAYGHSRLRNMLIGSTTTSLLQSCTVPCLLFR